MMVSESIMHRRHAMAQHTAHARDSKINSARVWSWILGGSSIVLPSALFLYQQHSFSEWASDQEGYVCGMPLLGMLMLSMLLSFGLSLCALLTGLAGYRELLVPRPKVRLLEALLVGGTFVAGLIGFAIFSLASLWD